MNKYQNGKIYVIRSPSIDKCYIGSTAEKTLSLRLAKHRANLAYFQKGKGKYCTSYDILQNGDAYITLLESYPCQNRDELHARERHYIDNYNGVIVNKQLPTGLGSGKKGKQAYDKMYALANKEKKKARDQAYYQANKVIIQARHKALYAAKKQAKEQQQ